MKKNILICILLLTAGSIFAQVSEADLWKNKVLYVGGGFGLGPIMGEDGTVLGGNLSPLQVVTLLGVLLLGILLLLFYVYTRLLGSTKKTADHTQFIPQLSNRELEVVETVLAGNKRYKEIADKLNISVSTVKFHLRNIYKITGASNIPSLLSIFRGYTSNSQ